MYTERSDECIVFSQGPIPQEGLANCLKSPSAVSGAPIFSGWLIEALWGRFGYSDLKEAAGSWVAMGFEWCCAEAKGIGDQWCQWCVVRIRIGGRVRGGKLV